MPVVSQMIDNDMLRCVYKTEEMLGECPRPSCDLKMWLIIEAKDDFYLFFLSLYKKFPKNIIRRK